MLSSGMLSSNSDGSVSSKNVDSNSLSLGSAPGSILATFEFLDRVGKQVNRLVQFLNRSRHRLLHHPR